MKDKVLEDTVKDNSNNENASILTIVKEEIVYLLLLNKCITNLLIEIVCNLNTTGPAILWLIISRLKSQRNKINLQ